MSLLPAAKIKCIDGDKTLWPEVNTRACSRELQGKGVSGKRSPPSAPCPRLPPSSWLALIHWPSLLAFLLLA